MGVTPGNKVTKDKYAENMANMVVAEQAKQLNDEK